MGFLLGALEGMPPHSSLPWGIGLLPTPLQPLQAPGSSWWCQLAPAGSWLRAWTVGVRHWHEGSSPATSGTLLHPRKMQGSLLYPMAQVLFILRLCLSFSASPVSFSDFILSPPHSPVHWTPGRPQLPWPRGHPPGHELPNPPPAEPQALQSLFLSFPAPVFPPIPTDVPILAAERKALPPSLWPTHMPRTRQSSPLSLYCPEEGAVGKYHCQ